MARDALLIAVLGLAAACSSGDAAPESAGAGHASAQAASFRLSRIKGGLGDAVGVYHAPGQANRLYIVQQRGTIRILQRGKLVGTPFLDISGDVERGGEQGLLGLAFHPDYASNGLFYVYYTDSSGDQQRGGRVPARGQRPREPRQRPRCCSHGRLPANHNGGHLAFGPDGSSTSLGDGGGGGDPRATARTWTRCSARSCASTSTAPTAARAYAIPADNPFVGGAGATEIWAYGLRNPWRFSFDRATGDLWIGDVGQDAVRGDRPPRAGRRRAAQLRLGEHGGHATATPASGCNAPASVPPVVEYTPRRGLLGDGRLRLSRRGGPGAAGAYIFADFCPGGCGHPRGRPGPRDDARSARPDAT